jgi:hypothetical protein
MLGTLSIIKAAFKVYSFFPAIYSLVPSIGSISQNIFSLFLILKSTVSSEIIGIPGVNSKILFVISSLALKSPLLTG